MIQCKPPFTGDASPKRPGSPSSSLIEEDISSPVHKSSSVRDLSLRPQYEEETTSPVPKPSTSNVGTSSLLEPGSKEAQSAANTVADSVQLLQQQSTATLCGTEAEQMLKSIQSEVNKQGKLLAAFIASDREFKTKLTADISSIKDLLEKEQSRSVSHH